MPTTSTVEATTAANSRDTQLVQVKVPKELHALAMAKAKETQTPLAMIIRVAISQWVKGELEIKIAA